MARRKSLLGVLVGKPSRKKPKGLFSSLLQGQAKTEKKNKMYPRRK